ncbi:MAG TPA: ABC transporter permease subunit [Nitrolancea sp.]|nr:ABC transporter permease subunit [Nitrolancea sp.]
MTGLNVLLTKELREQWRTLRLPIVAIIFFVVGLGSPVLAKYTPEIIEHAGGDIQITVPVPQMKDAIDQFIKNLGQVGPFAAILLAMGIVAREREHGTAAFVLSKPATRVAFLGAKFIALLVTFSVSVLAAGIAAYIYTAILFERPPIAGFVACCLLLLLGISVFVALTLLASTAIGSTLPAAGVGLGAYILMAILSAVPRLGHLTPLGLGDPAKALALGTSPPHLWSSLIASGLWIAVALVLAWLSFRHQEFGS